MKSSIDISMNLIIMLIAFLIIFVIVIALILSSKSGLGGMKDFGCNVCSSLITSWMNYIPVLGKILNPCVNMFSCCDQTTGFNCQSGGTGTSSTATTTTTIISNSW
jgi:hypothetical protein